MHIDIILANDEGIFMNVGDGFEAEVEPLQQKVLF